MESILPNIHSLFQKTALLAILCYAINTEFGF